MDRCMYSWTRQTWRDSSSNLQRAVLLTWLKQAGHEFSVGRQGQGQGHAADDCCNDYHNEEYCSAASLRAVIV